MNVTTKPTTVNGLQEFAPSTTANDESKTGNCGACGAFGPLPAQQGSGDDKIWVCADCDAGTYAAWMQK